MYIDIILSRSKLLSEPVCYIAPNKMRHKILKPPEVVRGITHVDRTLFEKVIQIPYLALKEGNISDILLVIKPYLLKLLNLKPVEIVEGETNIHLNPVHVQRWSNFPQEIQERLGNFDISESYFKEKCFVLRYDNYSTEDIFKAVLPEDMEGFSSFTRTGHIVHVNLREHLLPYKMLIGEVLFDKIRNCRSVINKSNIINNTFRNFQIEILKGDGDMLTTVKENNCAFKFDFSTVYWNSRLCTEHERVIKRLDSNDVLFDVFAGIGPFSIPIAKKKCYVFANDLNPDSYKWLNTNAELNKVDMQYFKTFNKDGKQFITQDIKQYLPEYLKRHQKVFVLMNLPAVAVEFLNNFVGLFGPDELPNSEHSPVVFVYCFAKGEDYINIAKKMVINGFGVDVSSKIIDVFRVRTVSNFKEMMRVAVRLDIDILVRSNRKRKLQPSLESKNKKYLVDL